MDDMAGGEGKRRLIGLTYPRPLKSDAQPSSLYSVPGQSNLKYSNYRDRTKTLTDKRALETEIANVRELKTQYELAPSSQKDFFQGRLETRDKIKKVMDEHISYIYSNVLPRVLPPDRAKTYIGNKNNFGYTPDIDVQNEEAVRFDLDLLQHIPQVFSELG